jgi:hypothetical protein
MEKILVSYISFVYKLTYHEALAFYNSFCLKCLYKRNLDLLGLLKIILKMNKGVNSPVPQKCYEI